VPLDVPRETGAAMGALDPLSGKLIAALPGRSRGRDRLAALRAKRFIDGGRHGYGISPNAESSHGRRPHEGLCRAGLPRTNAARRGKFEDRLVSMPIGAANKGELGTVRRSSTGPLTLDLCSRPGAARTRAQRPGGPGREPG
jgi:hypothetical protein